VALLVLAGPILATLFHSGNFTGEDVVMATRSLWAYSLGLVAFMAIKVLAPGFYARQDTRTPVRFAVVAMVANMVLNLLLMFPLAHAGLALATTLSATLNASLLLRELLRSGVYRPAPGWWRLLLRGAIASGVMGVAVVLGVGDVEGWLILGDWERVARLLLWIGVGGAVYALSLLALGIRPRHFLA
jgi:putative peptidoglycan lipid II flippase